MRDKFFIFDVTEDCLLVNYGSWGNDLKCMLWGADAKNIKTTRCFSTMKEMCTKEMQEIWGERGSCLDPDTREQSGGGASETQ